MTKKKRRIQDGIFVFGIRMFGEEFLYIRILWKTDLLNFST
jgi:hypothetical protein